MLLLFNSHASFVSSFNLEAHKLFGVNNAYAATNAAAAKAGYTAPTARASARSGRPCCWCPAMMFFILWPNWGATLYGEIRGASDFRRVFTGMFVGLWITVLLHRRLPAADGQDLRLGLLPEPNPLDYTPVHARSSASGRTRCCSPAGWCTTPRSRSS